MREKDGGVYCDRGYHKVHFRGQWFYFGKGQEKNAWDFLYLIRGKAREGSFDSRDYARDEPLGFANLGGQYLTRKKAEGKRSVGKMRWHLGRAIAYFDNRNIKTIAEPELEDFFLHLKQTTDLSSKTVYNIKGTLHAFWKDLERRERRKNPFFRVPEFPALSYTLAWRKIVDKETQGKILDEVKRISRARNPKIWVGCSWLATYALRPIELLHIKEGDFNYQAGYVDINWMKTGNPERLYVLKEDLDLARSFGPAFPNLYFFRHGRGVKGVREGTRFGDDYLREWWNPACENLGIKGVPLYPGTKHSTMTDWKNRFGPARAKEASRIKTDKASERYILADPEQIKELYSHARGKGKVVKEFAKNFDR